MATYGYTRYGQDTYGLTRPITVVPGGGVLPTISHAYLIDPFTAQAVDYQNVRLTWSGPDTSTGTPMTGFRLLSSRWGFPVDENDGNILIDTTSAPATTFVDQNVVPGQITYYGFYINTGSAWVRAGFTAALMPVNHGYSQQLWKMLPAYLQELHDSELTQSAVGNPYLALFLQVAAFSLDYLKTQYDFLFKYQNDPMKMSMSDLADLAGQLGMPFSGDIPGYYLRKAVDNWATVMRERGTMSGIAEHIALLSGFGADVQLSRNIMLENDQSNPTDQTAPYWDQSIPYEVGEKVIYPVYPQWVESQAYAVNNYVVYNGSNYQCIATGGQGIPPTGAATSGTYWTLAGGPFMFQCTSAVTSLPAGPPASIGGPGTAPTVNSGWGWVWGWIGSYPTLLAIPGLVGGLNTWEAVYSTQASTYVAPALTLVEGLGNPNPANYQNDLSHNVFQMFNRGSGAQNMWFRSVSRGSADVTAGSLVPDAQLVIEHAIPVPQEDSAWVSTTRYGTGAVVAYNGLNYLAQRASTGAVPPLPGVPLNSNWDFETGTSPWLSDGTAVLTWSTGFAAHGTHSMEVSYSGTASSVHVANSLENVPVIPGGTYTASAWVYSAAAGANVQLAANWTDAFGTYISGDFAALTTLAAGTWTLLTAQFTVPGNAATVFLAPTVNNPSPGNSFTAATYWDMVMLTCVSTPEWLPLGFDSRIPLVISTQTAQPVSATSNEQFAITPFVEWYDNWGNLISRVFARTPTPGTPGLPSGYTFDSFSTGANMPMVGRETDTQDQLWRVPSGAWTLSGAGTAYPVHGSTNPMALVNAALSCTQAVTFASAAAAGPASLGLVFWYQSANSFLLATMADLWYFSSGSWTKITTYAATCQPGDRLYVVTDQVTPTITVYRNKIGTYNSTTGNGQMCQVTGASVPSVVHPGSGATVYSGIYSNTV